MEGAWSSLLTASIDREILVNILEIAYADAQYRHLVDDIKHTSIQELKNLEFEIKPYKTGYRIIVNDGPPRLKIHSFLP